MKIERKILLKNSQDGIVYKTNFFQPFENEIKIYNLNINQSECESKIVVNTEAIESISISDDGLYILVINNHVIIDEEFMKIKIFEIASGLIVYECLSEINLEDFNFSLTVTNCIFGRKHEIIIVLAHNLVVQLNFLTGAINEYYNLKGYGFINDIYYSCESLEIFINQFPSKNLICLKESKITSFYAHSKNVVNLYCTSKYLILTSDEGIIKIRDLHSKKCLKTLDPISNGFSIYSLLVASNGLHMLASVSTKIYVWDIFTGKIIHIFDKIFKNVNTREIPILQSISDDGSQIITQVLNKVMGITNLELISINQRLPLLLYSHKFNNGIIYNLYSDGNITRFYRHSYMIITTLSSNSKIKILEDNFVEITDEEDSPTSCKFQWFLPELLYAVAFQPQNNNFKSSKSFKSSQAFKSRQAYINNYRFDILQMINNNFENNILNHNILNCVNKFLNF